MWPSFSSSPSDQAQEKMAMSWTIRKMAICYHCSLIYLHNIYIYIDRYIVIYIYVHIHMHYIHTHALYTHTVRIYSFPERYFFSKIQPKYLSSFRQRARLVNWQCIQRCFPLIFWKMDVDLPLVVAVSANASKNGPGWCNLKDTKQKPHATPALREGMRETWHIFLNWDDPVSNTFPYHPCMVWYIYLHLVDFYGKCR